ncbi:hypothetical protein G9A89_021271 [Geosiphon pyriformis]|nr:hypothetical protein G9A89_021271 [Geosiphon pyriformis]
MYQRQQRMAHHHQILLQTFKWDNMPCLACGKILPDEGLWNDVPGRGETCNKACQYTILINDWDNPWTPEYNEPDYSELEEIKEALAHGTKLPKTGEWTPDNAQK